MSHGVVPDRVAEGTRLGIAPLARRLAALGVSANAVTVTGALITCVGAALLAAGSPIAALVVLAFGTIADTLDGQIAKAAGGGTRFGAFLDSTMDRVADSALFVGAAVYAASAGQPFLLWSALVALVTGSLVPYVRAKAESLGVSASVGPAPREARIVIFLVGLAVWAFFDLLAAFIAAVVIVALLSSVTFVLRLAHVSRQLSNKER